MRSGFERKIAQSLEDRGISYEYELYQYPFLRRVKNGECGECGSNDVNQLGWYTPDFFLPNGIVIEAKGKFVARERTKILAVMETNPELDLRMMFQRDNKLTKRSTTRYSEWCDRHNIRYHIGTDIPIDWIEET